MGPLLYTISANDLSLYADVDASIVQYADDTQVLVTGAAGDIGSMVSTMEKNISELSHWFGKNDLKVNAAKTQLIVIGSRYNIKRLSPVTVNFMGAAVAGPPTVRNLGDVFDQSLTFSAHTDDVVRRCTGTLCGLA